MGLRDGFRFFIQSITSGNSRTEDRMAQYVIREHHRGRPLEEILRDHYVTNRCSPEQVRRLLEHPELLHAIGEDTVAGVQTQL